LSERVPGTQLESFVAPSVYQVLPQSRKTDKIASSDVARSRVDYTTFHALICLLQAMSSYAQPD
jgi:hypothetical protein